MGMKNKDFAVFILTYGRSDNVITVDTLRKLGYTGVIYLVCSTDDKSLPEYRKNYENIISFNKEDYEGKFDIGDNFNDKRVVVYARNAVFDLAKKVGVTYFLVLDDDYVKFDYRINHKGEYPENHWVIKGDKLDKIFDIYLDYFKSIDAKTICFSQGGDFIGGSQGSFADLKLRRKAMNCFFCSTQRPFNFVGRINEDATTYTIFGSRGDVFLTTPVVSVTQLQTQSNKGGLTEFYLDGGTYVKSFYTLMFHPSSVSIRLMGDTHKRLHHNINWNNTVPKIINPGLKK